MCTIVDTIDSIRIYVYLYVLRAGQAVNMYVYCTILIICCLLSCFFEFKLYLHF